MPINGRTWKKVTSEVSSAYPTIDLIATDYHRITALAENILDMSANITHAGQYWQTPSHSDRLNIEITAASGTRNINWGAKFEASSVALPTSVTTTTIVCRFEYNSATGRWRIFSVT